MAQQGQRISELINFLNTKEGLTEFRKSMETREKRAVGIEEARSKARDLVQGFGGEFVLDESTQVKSSVAKPSREDKRQLKELTSERTGEGGLVGKVDEQITSLTNQLRPALREFIKRSPAGAGLNIAEFIEDLKTGNIDKSAGLARPISDINKQLQNLLFGSQTQQSQATDTAVSLLAQQLNISPEEVRTGLKRSTGKTDVFRSLAGLGEIKTATGRRLIFNADGSVSEVQS